MELSSHRRGAPRSQLASVWMGAGSNRRRLAPVVQLALAAALLGPSTAAADSLYTGPGSRPGPELLYAKPAKSPQLSNRKPWRAKPILVSGATAYRKGEFLYQDWLYDDNGARLTADPADERSPGNLFSKQNGTYTYPTAEAYASNAADLLEFRVKPLRRSTAFRVSLNTMKAPSLVALSIAIGDGDGTPVPFPAGANVSAPADSFVTVHPEGGRLVADINRAGEAEPEATLRVRVDLRRRQIGFRIPHKIWNPRRSKVRFAAGVGLWDREADSYLLPAATASATTPGGAPGGSPAGFFNVAFRGDEPVQTPNANSDTVANAAWWRDRLQGTALAAGDISEFFAEVSFRKLARGKRDNRDVPKTGPMDRIHVSRFQIDQGADFGVRCFPGEPATCPGQYQGRLQPYAIYVPKKRSKRGYGMTLLLHSLSANYNQYLGSRNMEQYAERGPGSIVITPEARGPDEFYENYGAADVFEVWADVARRYELDPAYTVATGYSMGGIGSFKLASQFPDLFSRIHPTVGSEGETEVLASLRNVPVLMWNNNADELVNNASFMETAQALDDLGYRYELDAYQPCANAACSPLFPNHLQLAVNDQFQPGADFLGTERVARNPAHVTYVADSARSHPELDLVGDHAYWVSDVKLRDGVARGQIDATSRGFGVGDPSVSATARGTGILRGGNLGDLLFTSQSRTWGPVPAAPKRDAIDIVTTGIRSATIHAERARVSCGAELNVEGDGPVEIKLAGCGRGDR